MLLTQCDISNGEIGIAGSGSIEYAGEPRLKLGMAATPMPVSVLKRIWPVLVTPEVREWITERVERGTLQRLDIAVNAPAITLARGGRRSGRRPVDQFLRNGLTIRTVDEIPSGRDADRKGGVSGRTVNVTVGRARSTRRRGASSPFPICLRGARSRAEAGADARALRLDGPVPAAAEILQSERLRDFGESLIDPNSSKGTVSAVVTLGMPLKNALTKADTTYSVNLDLGGGGGQAGDEPEAGGEARQGGRRQSGLRVKATSRSADSRRRWTIARPARAMPTSACRRARRRGARRLGVDLGSSVSGAIPIKLSGRITSGDGDSRFGVVADLTAARIDNAAG